MTQHFTSTFRQLEAAIARGKHLSRVFGIFSEEIVRIWAGDPRAPYEDLGRPTPRMQGETTGSTLDFTLQSRSTGRIYVSELKCEIEYQGYKYLILTESRQLDHHNKSAFGALLAAAARHTIQRAFVGRKKIEIDGAILIWGATTSEGREVVARETGFFEMLTLAKIIADLRSWNSEPYRLLLEQRQSWSNELYDALLPNAGA